MNTDVDNNQDPLDQAAAWIARLRADDVDLVDKKTFADWLAAVLQSYLFEAADRRTQFERHPGRRAREQQQGNKGERCGQCQRYAPTGKARSDDG